jgi:DNA modification methylase
MMENYINKLFWKDNLELLKELPSNSIDLIYGDILYATGRDFEIIKI